MEVQAHRRRLKKTHTGVIFGCLFALGLITAVYGGTVTDLKEIYDMDSSGLSQIIVTRSAGTLFGSLLCGNYLYQRMNAKIVIILSLIFGGLGTAIVPDVAPHYWIAHIGFFVSGFSVGALEVGCNVWLVQLWEGGVNPMMQSYHVSFGTGALLAPIMTTPFLSAEANKTINATHLDLGVEMFDLNAKSTATNSTSLVAVPYALFGGLYSFMGLVILFFCFIDPTELRQHEPPAAGSEPPASTLRFEWTIVALLSAYVLADVIFETVMSNSLADYVLSYPDLGIDKKESEYMLSLFWATYTIGRILTIFMSLLLKPKVILILFQCIASIGTGILLLLAFPSFAGRVPAWIATGVIGFGLSTLYPSGFTWAVRYIHLKYTHMSILLVAACTGAMLPTYLVAPYIKSSTAVVPLVSMSCAVLLMCILIVMLFTTRNRLPIYDRDDERDLIIADTEDEENREDLRNGRRLP